jgi:photosystem II stability/assembly factor-like uncharacterized protein
MKKSTYILLYCAIVISWSLTACVEKNIPKPLDTDSSAKKSYWKDLGLYSGQVPVIAIDPQLGVTFAGTAGGGGLYYRSDSENPWKPVLSGAEETDLEGEATFRNTTVWDIGFSSDDPRTMWVLHDFRLEKSAPGSYLEWEHIDIQQRLEDCDDCDSKPSARRVCRSLAIISKPDGSEPDLVFVGTSGPPGSINDGAIYRSTNAGESWQKLGPYGTDGFNGTVTKILYHPSQTNLMFALAVAKDTKGNESSTLYISESFGDSWERWSKGSFEFRAYDFQLLPLDPEQVKFFMATEQGLYSSFDFSKEIQFNKSLGKQPILAMAFDSNQPKVMYASVRGRGIARGIPDPENKTVVFKDTSGQGFEFISLDVDTESKGKLLCGDFRRGVFWAAYDPGSETFSFSPTTDGINARNVHDLDVIPAAGETPSYLIAATNTGATIKRGDDEWQPVVIDKLPRVSASAVAYNDRIADGSHFYVGGPGYLAHTVNGGKSWQINETDIPPDMQVSDIAIAADGLMLFVAARGTEKHIGQMYKSTDGVLKLAAVGKRDKFDINSVAINPRDPMHIIAGGGNYESSENTGAFIESFDGGKSWKDTGLEGIVVNAVLFDPEYPQIIYAGCGNKDGTVAPLYKRTDRDGSWQLSHEGIAARPLRPGIWGNSVDNVHALGHTGSIVMDGLDDRRILNFRGRKQSIENDSGVSERLEGIWGQAPNDIFAVGERGAIIHYNGSQWSAMEAEQNRTTDQDLYAVWGRSGSDVYAVGETGTFLHYDGQTWSNIATSVEDDLYGVWTDAKTEHTYLVGWNGTIIDYFNGKLSTTPPSTKADLNGIWGMPGENSVFVVGAPREDDTQKLRYTIIRFDGRNWSPMETAVVQPGYGQLNGVWGTSPTDVFAVGDDGIILHFDGKSWTKMDSGSTSHLYGVWGISSNSVYAVGNYGTILFYNGKQWLKVDQGTHGRPVESITKWNAVTDLTYNSADIESGYIYASTARQGVYFSTDYADTWVNVSAPPYSTMALGTGPFNPGGSGAYLYSTAIGLVCLVSGTVKDKVSLAKLKDASVKTVPTVFDEDTTDRYGKYHLILPMGKYKIKASRAGYHPKKKKVKCKGKRKNFKLRKK